MSRKPIQQQMNDTCEDLKNLIDRYAQNKSEMESYKKLVDADNKEIKAQMLEQGLKVAETDDYTASCTISNRVSIDEDKLLELMLDRGYTNIIKTKQYVDMDLLESALYHNEIDADTVVEMDECKHVTEVVTLKVSRRK